MLSKNCFILSYASSDDDVLAVSFSTGQMSVPVRLMMLGTSSPNDVSMPALRSTSSAPELITRA